MNYLYVQQVLSLEAILAAVFGLGLVAALVGDRQTAKRPVPGQLIFLTGIATAAITVLAATNLFAILPASTGLGALIGLVSLVLYRALRHDARYLSYVGLAALYVLPYLVDAEVPNWLFLTNYGLIVFGFGMWLHLRRSWPVLGLLTFGGSVLYFYGISNLGELRGEYALIYLLALWGGDLLLHWTRRASWGLALTRSLGALALISGLNQTLISSRWQHPIWTALALASLGVAYLFRYGARRARLTRTYFLYAVFYVVCLVAAKWSGLEYLPLLTAGGVVFGTALVHRTLNDKVLLRLLAAGQTLPLIMTISRFDRESYLPNVIGVSLAAALTTGLLYLQGQEDELDDTLYKTLIVTTLLGGHASVWEALRRLFENNSLAAGVSLLLFTIGPIWLLYRLQITDRFWRVVSWVILGFVVVRLLSVEVWVMTPLIRVLTFVGVGVWFILTAYLRKEKPSSND